MPTKSAGKADLRRSSDISLSTELAGKVDPLHARGIFSSRSRKQIGHVHVGFLEVSRRKHQIFRYEENAPTNVIYGCLLCQLIIPLLNPKS
jgi:hypothetical protein